MSLFRDADGRLLAGWRVALFYLLFLVSAVVLSAVTGLVTPAPGEVPLTLLYTAVTLAAALAASWWFAEKVEGLPLAGLGLPLDRLVPAELGRGFLAGAGFIGLAVVALAVSGAATWRLEPGGLQALPLLTAFLQLTLFLTAAAWAEELLFRGYPLQALAERWGGRVAVVVTSGLFAAAHGANPGLGSALADGAIAAAILPLLNLGLAGVVLGLAYWRTYSLWFATGVHLGWNWLMGFAADLPVSGLEGGTPGYALFDTPGFEAVVEGGRLWTGGDFGPEGGLAVTLASVVAIAWLATTDRLDRSLRVRAMEPLPDRRAGSGAAREGTPGHDRGRATGLEENG